MTQMSPHCSFPNKVSIAVNTHYLPFCSAYPSKHPLPFDRMALVPLAELKLSFPQASCLTYCRNFHIICGSAVGFCQPYNTIFDLTSQKPIARMATWLLNSSYVVAMWCLLYLLFKSNRAHLSMALISAWKITESAPKSIHINT